MIGVVLLQKSEGGGLVSSTSGFMTGRGTANVLTRTTALLGGGVFRHQPRFVMAGRPRAASRPRIINTGGAPVQPGSAGEVRADRAARARAAAGFSNQLAAYRAARPRRPRRRRAGRKCRSRNRHRRRIGIRTRRQRDNGPQPQLPGRHEDCRLQLIDITAIFTACRGRRRAADIPENRSSNRPSAR